MSEPVFFSSGAGLSVAEVAALVGLKLAPGDASARQIFNVAPLENAGPRDLAFIDHVRLEKAARATHAGACFTTQEFAAALPTRTLALIVSDPYRAFVGAARALFPQAIRPSSLFEAQGVAKSAIVHPTARIEAGVSIDPGAMIGPRVEIGSGTSIGALAVIGSDVRIGRDCRIGPGATLTHTLLGDRVVIRAGCRIGQDGTEVTQKTVAAVGLPQTGRVIIQDDVEIGAVCAIDRGGLGDTVIGEGARIDSLVQIGHDATVGRQARIAAQAGIAGNTMIGEGAFISAGRHD